MRRRLRPRALVVALVFALVGSSCSDTDDGADGGHDQTPGLEVPVRAELTLTIEDDRIVIADATNGVTLRQAPVGDDARNAGFRRGDTWTPALSIAESSATTIRWTTADPATDLVAHFDGSADDPNLQWSAEGGDPVDGVSVGFESDRGERFVGFGERSNAVDQRGNEVEHYVAEGPYVSEDYDIIGAVVPEPGLRERPDATYFPMPWLLSSRGYGILVADDDRSVHHLDESGDGTWSVEIDSSAMDLRLFTGADPAEVVRHFTDSIGRQPDTGGSAVLGPWIQPGPPLDGPAAVVEWITTTDTPTSVVQTYLHYLPCGDHVGRTPAERTADPDAYHEAGIAVTTYVNPMVCRDHTSAFEAALAAGALTRDRSGQPYIYDYFGSQPFEVGQVDFTGEAGVAFYRELLGEPLGDGFDGWMEDFGEYTPLDAVGADGITGTAGHNAYVRQYHAAAHSVAEDLDRPLLRFVRSGWTGSAAVSPIVWGGDPSTTWDEDGLRAAVTNGLTMGLSGVGIWGSDIGGFFTLSAPQLTPELLIRWIQFGAFSGVMRTQANGFGATDTRPQIFTDPVAPLWRRYAKLRTQLFPYLAASADQYRASGMPMMRHHLLTDPGDPAAEVDDQYRFGDWLLVAPILEPGATSRPVVLPDGTWFDLTRTLTYDEATGASSLTGSAVLRGGRTAEIDAGLDEVPLLVAAGAVISMLPADVQSLAENHTQGTDVVGHLDRADKRLLLAFPRGRSTSILEPGETATSTEVVGESWTLSIVGAPAGRIYRLTASLAGLEAPFEPCAATLAGDDLGGDGWSWDAEAQLLSTDVELHAGDLVIRSC